MASIGEQILARAAAALLGATPAGSSVFRSRETSLTRAVAPSIVIMPQDEPSSRQGQFTDQSSLDVDFEVFTRGDPWDSLADAVYVPMHNVVMTDAALRALCGDVRRTRRGFDGQEADRTAGTLTVTYRFTFLTAATDVSVGPKP